MYDDRIISPRPRTGRRLVRLAVLLLVGCALLVVARHSWSGLSDDLRAVDVDLSDTAGDLDDATVDLTRHHATLVEDRADLAAAEQHLARRVDERKAAEDRLIAAEGTLDDTNSDVAHRTGELGQREANLALLNRCFVGASEALNQIAVGDTLGFATTLREIRGVCTAAREGM